MTQTMFFYCYTLVFIFILDDKQGRTGNNFIFFKSNIRRKKSIVTLRFNNIGQFENGSEESPTTIENFLRRIIEKFKVIIFYIVV